MTNLTLFAVVFLIFQNNVLSNSQAHECMENVEDESNTDQHLLEFHILEAKHLINLEKIKYIAQLDAALETETNQLQAELKRTDSEVKILTEKRDHQFSEELIQLGLDFAANTKKFVKPFFPVDMGPMLNLLIKKSWSNLKSRDTVPLRLHFIIAYC